MHQLQWSWVRSQYPSAQWNLRGGRWSSAEYCTNKKKKSPQKILKFKKSHTWAPLSHWRRHDKKAFLRVPPHQVPCTVWNGWILMYLYENFKWSHCCVIKNWASESDLLKRGSESRSFLCSAKTVKFSRIFTSNKITKSSSSSSFKHDAGHGRTWTHYFQQHSNVR